MDQSSSDKTLTEKLRSIGFDTETALEYCGGEEDIYEEVLKDITASYAGYREELESHYSNKDLKNYGIRVHALKSLSKTIGVPELASLGLELEKAADNGDASFIEKHHGEFLVKYDEVIRSVSEILYPKEETDPGSDEVTDDIPAEDYSVVVVDDEITNLKLVGRILSAENINVTLLQSGQELLEYVEDHKPDLILLDIKMPVMDGFETIMHLREREKDLNRMPIILFTSDEREDTEEKGLKLGAVDFIKKPVIAATLKLRVKRTLELTRLRINLADEVKRKTLDIERKTRENERLSFHIVMALAQAIDAKDTYTNGHSERVADYSREIARRYGYNDEQLNEIYMMGLLHDVGKIGVPNTIINKPSRLTDDEFEVIKTHPVLGSKILGNIKEMPRLANGARWHHERYGGMGYPDSLKGTDIPEEARIIAVADAYDAMTSNRSYRDPLSQDTVRNEIEKGKGTQFDPVFAEIMLKMIDEDKDYRMRE